MVVEMYKTAVVVDVTFRITQDVYVYADGAETAKKRVNNEVKNMKDNTIRRRAGESKAQIRTQIISAKPKMVAPQKGRKRPPLTLKQKNTIKAMVLGGPEKSKLQYSPKTGWRNTAAGEGFRSLVDVRTVVALRERGLIKPLITTENELKAQQAVGSLDVGEFIFVLNMDEVRKRKVYHDVIDQKTRR